MLQWIEKTRLVPGLELQCCNLNLLKISVKRIEIVLPEQAPSALKVIS